MHRHGGHGDAFGARGEVTVLCRTCFDSPIVSMFEQSENVTTAPFLYL